MLLLLPEHELEHEPGQITGMGNRTVIVDNNTRNNTHIATVGLVMASGEERAYPILRRLDVCHATRQLGN